MSSQFSEKQNPEIQRQHENTFSDAKLRMSPQPSHQPGTAILCANSNVNPPKPNDNQILTIERLQRQVADLLLSLQRTQELTDLYRFIADTAADAIIAIDHHNEIIYANPGLQRLLGYRPFDLMGKPLVTLIPEPYREAHTNAFRRYLETNERTINWSGIELEVLHQNGETIPVEVAFGAMQGRDGTIRFTGFFRDIRERKRQEQLARVQLAKTAHTHRVNTIGAFSAGLAHELNQPLSAICLNAGLIKQLHQQTEQSIDSGDVASIADELVSQSERAASIIKLIRGMIKQDTPRKAPVPVERIFQTLEKLVRYRARECGIQLTIQPVSSSMTVYAQEHQIEQLLLNLINNAFDAVETLSVDHRNVTLSARAMSLEEIEITVTDTGPGIKAELKDKLFDSFVTSKQDGVGIGLNICHQIAQSHHGQLTAHRNRPTGAKMVLTLPVKSTSDQPKSLPMLREGES